MWEELWSSAVTELGIQPEAAWCLTPHDFWKLWDNKLRQQKKASGEADRMTLEDVAKLEEELTSKWPGLMKSC